VKPVKIMQVPIHPVTNEMMMPIIEKFLTSDHLNALMTPNPEMVMSAQGDKRLMTALKEADLVIPDGIGLIIASRLRHLGLRERVTGIDTMDKILRICAERRLSFFLLGGKPGRAEKAAANICRQFPGIRTAGTHHGYFNENENSEVLALIKQKSPEVIFVCLGFPRQEIWINQHKALLPGKIVMGAGGSIDVYAGEVKRAPVFYQRIGLEWFYRLMKEPSRITRMIVLPIFLWKAIWMRKETGVNS
jgi:N-acetylglucosaminyldiphosphoundecaprenol N-acetyl-beta-D-mannosaminyltransferase